MSRVFLIAYLFTRRNTGQPRNLCSRNSKEKNQTTVTEGQKCAENERGTGKDEQLRKIERILINVSSRCFQNGNEVCDTIFMQICLKSFQLTKKERIVESILT